MLEIGFIRRRRSGLPLLFFEPQSLAALCFVGERSPGLLGPAATLAYMGEGCRFSLVTRLRGACEEEFEI